MYSPGELSKARKVLGIGAEATPDEIRHAYRDLIKVWHPDRFEDDPPLQAKAEEELKRINAAHALLVSSEFPGRVGRPPAVSSWAPPPDIVFMENDPNTASGWFTRLRMRVDVPVLLVAGLLAVMILTISLYEPSLPSLQAEVRPGGPGPEVRSPLRSSAKLTRLLLPENQSPAFQSIAPLFDPSISQSDYDKLRNKYFTEVASLKAAPDATMESMREEFFKETERAVSVMGSGLSYRAADRLMDRLIERAHLYFTVGSAAEDVRGIQGRPTRIEGGSVDPSETIWTYGFSSVFFKNGRVSRWNDPFPSLAKVSQIKPLRARNFPPESNARKQFELGSTKDDVFWAQGPPDEFNENTWKYGSSRIAFDRGKVSGWKESADAPLKHARMTRAAGNLPPESN